LIGGGPIENDVSNNSSIFACVFVAAVTFLPNPWLVAIEDKHTNTDRCEAFMRYYVEVGSDAMPYVPSFIKMG
jgi:hypothetical protein